MGEKGDKQGTSAPSVTSWGAFWAPPGGGPLLGPAPRQALPTGRSPQVRGFLATVHAASRAGHRGRGPSSLPSQDLAAGASVSPPATWEEGPTPPPTPREMGTH